MPAALPMAKVIAGAVVLAWERRYALLHALWLPLLLGMAFTISETLWGPSSWQQDLPGQGIPDQVSTVRGYSDQGSTVQGSADQKAADQSSTDQGSAGQRSAGQRSAGQRSAGQRSAGQRSAGQRSAGQQSFRQGSLFLWTLPLFVLTVVFAVRGYRVFLLGDEQLQALPPFSWGLRETRFVFAMAAIAFLFAMASVMFGSVVGVLWPGVTTFAKGPFGLVLILPPAYLAGRLLLAFPVIATDDSVDVMRALGRSWTMSRNNGLRLLGLCVLAPGVIAWSLGELSALAIPGIGLLSAVAVWLVMPVELAIVALSYATLKRAGASAPD